MDQGAGSGARPSTYAQRITSGHVADGERRVVGADRAGADEHGVALGTQAVSVGPGRLAGDPLAASRRGPPSVRRPSRPA